MDFIKWENQKAYTVGSELEVRIHNPTDLTLKEISSQIIPLIPKEIKKNIHSEFLECMIEFVSPVCKNSSEVINYIKSYVDIVKAIGEKNDFILATSGSCSLNIESLKIVDSERYKYFANEYGILLKKFHICGIHVHVGMSSSDEALHVYNYMLDKLPLFLAMSANSPFYDGQDTGLLSYRTQLFDQLPRAGIPEYFNSFEDIANMYEFLKKSGIVETSSDLWWDLRISPKFKTLEIRICDASNDFERLEDLINFYQALCFYASSQITHRLPYQILKQNKWNAAKRGFDGVYQNNQSIITMKKYFLDLIKKMEEKNIFEQLNINSLHVERLKNRTVEKSLAQRQKDIYKKTNSLMEVEKLGIFK